MTDSTFPRRFLADLRPDPMLLVGRSRITHDSKKWESFKDSIRPGVIEPLTILADGTILAGYSRFTAAKAVGLLDVPVQVVPEDMRFTILAREFLNQKTLTVGQKAYGLYPMLTQLLAECRARQIENLKHQDGSREPIQSVLVKPEGLPSTFEEVCKFHGFSIDTAQQAGLLHRLWAGDPKALAQFPNVDRTKLAELRAEWEPKILDQDNPVGLGYVKNGIAGQSATKDKANEPNPETQLELFTTGFEALSRVGADRVWGKLGEGKKPAFLAVVAEQAAGWNKEFIASLIETLRPLAA